MRPILLFKVDLTYLDHVNFDLDFIQSYKIQYMRPILVFKIDLTYLDHVNLDLDII